MFNFWKISNWKQKSSQNDFIKGFQEGVGVCWNLLQIFVTPGRNMHLGITYITRITSSTDTFMNCFEYMEHREHLEPYISLRKRMPDKCAKNNFHIAALPTELFKQFVKFAFKFKKLTYERQFKYCVSFLF